ncbi:zinc ribbon domain-containing protein [Paenarthrobacter sp. S56]|uniref:zinc ribbon domain-containing protein n=1 Tax=Paenarthrobacter sp. S56 TaxID=3138179 RepID=UPI00321C13B6
MTAVFQRCANCRAAYFPFRLVCSRCANTSFIEDDVDSGLVEAVTLLANGQQTATLVCPDDVHFIARVMGGTVKAGDRINLTNSAGEETALAGYIPFQRNYA